MKRATRLGALFFTALLCLSVPPEASGQQPKEWTWRDPKGNVRSRADLDKILAQHKLWVDSGRKSGTQAGLIGADLRDAHLNQADLAGADLNGALLSRAHLNDADLAEANLETVFLNGADLRGANLSGANLYNAALEDANLSNASLQDAHLQTAILQGTDLTGADLRGADLEHAVFEPKTLPTLEGIAQALNLELMTYGGFFGEKPGNPGSLTQLRKQFQDAGYRRPEREITCVLNREEAKRDSDVESSFKWIAFDLTCQYGLTPGRPLRIALWLWLLFSLIYAVFMHSRGPSGIYFIGSRVWRGRSNTQGIQIRPRAIRATRWWKVPFLWLRREWRVLRAAMFFSLMSAFNIGFRDINFGRWLRLLTRREYDLKAVGWARTVSGFQSLLSVYLIALWVLTYFGRPFG